MTKCVFCGREESPFRGVHLITNDGFVNFYCSSKCRKNALNLKRDRKKVAWTEAHRIASQKAMATAELVKKQESEKKAETPASEESKKEIKKKK